MAKCLKRNRNCLNNFVTILFTVSKSFCICVFNNYNMVELLRIKYQITQPRDFPNSSPFSSDFTSIRRDPQLNESERVQSNTNDRNPPFYVELNAAPINESSFQNHPTMYSINTNDDRSNSRTEQQFTVADNRKSLEETTKNKKTKQPVNWSRSSRSFHSRRRCRSDDSSCCCCCFVSNNDNELASDQYDYNDNCCQCDNCCECDNCCDCGSCDCGSCDCGSCDCGSCDCGSCDCDFDD